MHLVHVEGVDLQFLLRDDRSAVLGFLGFLGQGRAREQFIVGVAFVAADAADFGRRCRRELPPVVFGVAVEAGHTSEGMGLGGGDLGVTG